MFSGDGEEAEDNDDVSDRIAEVAINGETQEMEGDPDDAKHGHQEVPTVATTLPVTTRGQRNHFHYNLCKIK